MESLALLCTLHADGPTTLKRLRRAGCRSLLDLESFGSDQLAGLLEVTPAVVTVLADTAIRATDIDEAAAIEAQQKAEQALRDSQADIDYARTKAELAQAVAQLQALKKIKKIR